ncbi:MAG TPA: SBBP repeat-containing protein [Candidatus Krumholzibacteria bacterium]|nr:SBBP repeat-containing protein [Candidatus Krumholzibacteria bacterium]
MMPRHVCAALLALPLVWFAPEIRAAPPAHFWSQGFGDMGFDQGTSVAVDPAGNVYVTGLFSGTVDFGRDILTSAGLDDIFVAKYASSGIAQWAKNFGGTGGDHGYGIALDAAGNIFVTGIFNDTVDFGGGPLVADNQTDIFLVKFDADGNHVWSQRFGDFGPDYGNAVAVDAAGNVIVCGLFQNTVDFGGGPLISAGSYDIFVAKYDTNGLHQWSKRFGNTGPDSGTAVAADAAGNVFITGAFEGTVDFGGGNLVNPGGGADLVLAKYDENGAHVWSQAFGAVGTQLGRALTTDAAGNAILAGFFQGSVNFGGGPLVASSVDIVLAKYAVNGAHIWSKKLGDVASDDAFGVTTDAASNILLTGFFTGTVDFGGGGITSTSGSVDLFLAKYDANGSHVWSAGYGGAGGEVGLAVAVDGPGNPVITGYFEPPASFGGDVLSGGGFFDMLLAKYGREPAEPIIASITDSPNDQGGKVKVRFARSGHDQAASPTPIGAYEIYRRDDPPPATSIMREPVALSERRLLIDGWTYLVTVPPHGETTYAVDVPTIGDSTIALGQYHSVFFVRGSTASPYTFFDSPADSGWSLDNLAPGAPQNLVYAAGQLFWSQPATVDFDYFTVYGSDMNLFSNAIVIDYTVPATLDVAASPYAFYFITATDFSGNESAPASFGTATGVGGTPQRYVLSVSNFPNPFNPRTTVSYTVPSRGNVTVSIYDARGARVATLVDDEVREAGAYSIEWNGRREDGAAVASGVYFARIEHDGTARSKKMVLLK